MDHLPLVASFIDKARIPQVIDAYYPMDPQLEISYGTTVKAMILSILTGRYLLYKISRCIKLCCSEMLLGEGIRMSKFTDDWLAETLDHLYKTGLEFSFSRIIIGVIESFHIGIDFLHQDNSSIKLYGVYEQETEGPKVINGFSRDHALILNR